jgi:hypothetical protein
VKGDDLASITIIFKDGSKREFPHKVRAGGSYTKSVKYEGSFVVVEDEWRKKTAFPMDTVKEVIEEPHTSGW